MAYRKLNLQDGEVLDEVSLAHMEAGIAKAAEPVLDPDHIPVDETGKKAVHQKIYVGDHYLEQVEIDPGSGLYQLLVRALKDDFTIFTVKSPENKKGEATFSLMNEGQGTVQFLDISTMRYNDEGNGQIMMVCQSRGNTPLPTYYISFNSGTGRVHKLQVEPDSIPMIMTSKGLKVRKDNTYDNEWTDANSVVINFADLVKTLSNMQSDIDAFSKVANDFKENMDTQIELIFEDVEPKEVWQLIEVEEPDVPPVGDLLYSWDFTTSLVDAVSGVSATLSGAEQTSSGVLLNSATDYCSLGNIFAPGRTIEFDVADQTSALPDATHGRCFMIYSSDVKGTEGLIWRHQTGHWAFYANGAWSEDLPITDKNAFSGKTVRLMSDSNGYLSLYIDGLYIGKSNIIFTADDSNVSIGSTYNANFFNIRVTGVRVYSEVA